jgi:hypothetical protein
MRLNPKMIKQVALLALFSTVVLSANDAQTQRESDTKISMEILSFAAKRLASNAAPQQNGREDWGKATAKMLAGFLPDPVPGLINHLPRNRPHELRLREDNSCAVDGGCGRFPAPEVTMIWDFDDPDPAKRPRSLLLSVAANDSLGSDMKSAGTVKGYPLYRHAMPDATSSYVRLAVLVGPITFRNPAGPQAQLEVKTVLVTAQIRSTPEALKGDEALTRQMLEKIDYDGLKKLLQP